MSEDLSIRKKRVRMRAGHRGMKEMDLILGGFVDANLSKMAGPELDELELLMAENDQDLYLWVTSQTSVPAKFRSLVRRIAQCAGSSG